MAEIFPRDVLLRVGGKTLQRGTLVTAGAGRSLTDTPYTFTRTCKRAFRDSAGGHRVAANNALAIEYPSGLVDAAGNPLCGLVAEGSRAQLIGAPENFAAWTTSGVTLAATQADPFGGTSAQLLDSFTPNAGDFLISPAITYTGNGTKAFAIYLKAGTSTVSDISIFDGAVGHRHRVKATWTAGVPALSTVTGTGTLFTVEPVVAVPGWYRIPVSANSIVAANSNQFVIYPDSSGGGGTVYIFGANTWDQPFPSNYYGPGYGTAAADALSLSLGFGPQDITVLARIARPAWADLSGDIGGTKSVYEIGTAAAQLQLYAVSATRDLVSIINTTGTDSQVQAAIPAGTELRICSQYKNLTTAPQVAHDVGSGMSAFGGVGTAFSAFGNQTLRIGSDLYGTLIDLIVFRGLFSKAEAEAMALV